MTKRIWKNKMYTPYRFTEEDRLKHYHPAICLGCDKGFKAYGQQSTCSEKCRVKIALRDPIDRKVRSLSANVLMGKDKSKIIKKFLLDHLGKCCLYCGVELTLENVGLDHKNPIGSVRVRRDKINTVDIRKKLDRLENLQLICRSCNGIKGKIPHEKFAKLLFFLNKDLELKELILQRLKQSIILWAKR